MKLLFVSTSRPSLLRGSKKHEQHFFEPRRREWREV